MYKSQYDKCVCNSVPLLHETLMALTQSALWLSVFQHWRVLINQTLKQQEQNAHTNNYYTQIHQLRLWHTFVHQPQNYVSMDYFKTLSSSNKHGQQQKTEWRPPTNHETGITPPTRHQLIGPLNCEASHFNKSSCLSFGLTVYFSRNSPVLLLPSFSSISWSTLDSGLVPVNLMRTDLQWRRSPAD